MFRVYDIANKRWIREGVFLAQDGGLYLREKRKFTDKLTVVDVDGYMIDMNTEIKDKDGFDIYENDIVEFGNIVGLVAWSNELGQYVFLDTERGRYYSMPSKICAKYAKIIGCCEETPELLPKKMGERNQ